MNLLLFLTFGLFLQALWSFAASSFGLDDQAIPLFVLFAYSILVCGLPGRLFMAVALGWFIDLHGGSTAGLHVSVFACLAFCGSWFQRNLSFSEARSSRLGWRLCKLRPLFFWRFFPCPWRTPTILFRVGSSFNPWFGMQPGASCSFPWS